MRPTRYRLRQARKTYIEFVEVDNYINQAILCVNLQQQRQLRAVVRLNLATVPNKNLQR